LKHPILPVIFHPLHFSNSLGGMLLVKLDSNDLQFEKMSPFEGTLAYAQNKRQQVVMTDHLAKQHPNVQFTTMHPGENFVVCHVQY